MNWTILKTEDDYTKASNRLMEIFHAEANTLENAELELLMILVKDYDDRFYPLSQIVNPTLK